MELSPDFLLVAGSCAALLALVAWFGDHRRKHRRDPDAVGFVDWTTLFFIALLTACLLLGGGLRLWFSA